MSDVTELVALRAMAESFERHWLSHERNDREVERGYEEFILCFEAWREIKTDRRISPLLRIRLTNMCAALADDLGA